MVGKLMRPPMPPPWASEAELASWRTETRWINRMEMIGNGGWILVTIMLAIGAGYWAWIGVTTTHLW